MAEKHKPKIGDRAPEFSLESASGMVVSLSGRLGRSEVVLFFYPKAFTPVCTAEACAFRVSEKTFRDAGAEVIGISSDSPETLKRFAEKFRLPFVLLSDPGGEVRRLYGVSRTLGVLPGRSTFLIDRDGYIQHIFTSQFLPTKHVAEMLEALRTLRGAGR